MWGASRTRRAGRLFACCAATICAVGCGAVGAAARGRYVTLILRPVGAVGVRSGLLTDSFGRSSTGREPVTSTGARRFCSKTKLRWPRPPRGESPCANRAGGSISPEVAGLTCHEMQPERLRTPLCWRM
jgi:hypothetical protein